MAIPSDPYRIAPRRRQRPVHSTFRPKGIYCSDSEWSSSSSSSSSSGSSSASGSSSSTLKPSPSSSWDFDDPSAANVIPDLRQQSKMRLAEAFLRKDVGAPLPTMPSRPAPSPPSISDYPQPMARASSRGIRVSRPGSRDRPSDAALVTPTRGSSMGDRTAPLSPASSSSASTRRRSRSLMSDSPLGSAARHKPSTSSPSSSSTVSPSQTTSITPRSTSQAVMTPSVAAANARLTEAMLNELEDHLAESQSYSPPSDVEMISLPSCDSIALFALGLPSSSATELSMASAPAVGPSSPRRREQLPSSSQSTLTAATAPLRLGGVPDRAELIKPWVEQVSQAAQRSVGALPMRETSGETAKDEVSLRERRSKAPLTLRLAKSQTSLSGQAIVSANSLLRSGLRSPGIYSPPPCPPPTAPLPNLPSMADSIHATPRQVHAKRRSANQPSPLRGESSYSQTWRISAVSNVSCASSFKTSAESLSRNSIDARSGFNSARNSHLSTASLGASAGPVRRSRGMTFSGGYRLSSSTELSYYSQRSESPSECASSSSALSQNSPKTPLTPLDTLDLSGMQGHGMSKGGLGLDALTQLANALKLEHGDGAVSHHARKESLRFAMPGQYDQDEDVVYGIAL